MKGAQRAWIRVLKRALNNIIKCRIRLPCFFLFLAHRDLITVITNVSYRRIYVIIL